MNTQICSEEHTYHKGSQNLTTPEIKKGVESSQAHHSASKYEPSNIQLSGEKQKSAGKKQKKSG